MNRKLKNEELDRLNLKEFKESSKTPLIVVLDNIRSANNIGAVFRSSDAFRIEAIYLCGITAQPPHRDIHKTALGSTDTVEWKYFESTLDALKVLKGMDYKIAAIEQASNKIDLNQFNPNLVEQKWAVIFGNEVFGVSQEAVNEADCVVEIPQIGSKHSLNISVSAGIVLWDLFKKYNYSSEQDQPCSS